MPNKKPYEAALVAVLARLRVDLVREHGPMLQRGVGTQERVEIRPQQPLARLLLRAILQP